MSSPSSSSVPIVFLKTRSTPVDNYAEYFTQPSTSSSSSSKTTKGETPPTFSPTFIPVLKHTFNLSAIHSWIASVQAAGGKPPTHGGLIFTSQRAVEAFGAALDSQSDPKGPSEPPRPPPLLPSLSLPLYVVGPATAKALGSVATRHLPGCRVLGAESGNGEELARFIQRAYRRDGDREGNEDENGHRRLGRPPLLFFVGEQRRDVIPRTLMDEDLPAGERVEVEERVVYETGVEDGFEAEFGVEIEAMREAGKAAWVVVFSPTGCDAMLRVLGWEKGAGWKTTATSTATKGGGIAGSIRVAAIGPTTRDHLKSNFGFEADVTAAKPSPEGVRAGIEEYMKEHAIS